MEQLGQEQIDSILLEGGGTLNWSALESGIVQQVQAYICLLYTSQAELSGLDVCPPAGVQQWRFAGSV